MAKDRYYDIIVRGAGLAGLSLALALVHARYKGNIFIFDKAPSPMDNKTWCFWGSASIPEYLQTLIAKTWSSWTLSDLSSRCKHTSYSKHHDYCCIRASDFFSYAIRTLSRHKNVTLVWGVESASVGTSVRGVVANVNNELITARYGFDSTYNVEPPLYKTINQYFTGAWVSSELPIFEDSTVKLMDNMSSDAEKLEFTYVLPISPYEGLIELTRFSLAIESLDAMQRKTSAVLINIVGHDGFQENRWERGVLPMDTRLKSTELGNWHNIGINGGMIRASSGYAFQTIQRVSRDTAKAIVEGNFKKCGKGYQGYYQILDSIFLKVLRQNMQQSPSLFLSMASNTDAKTFSRFMIEQASIFDVARVIRAMPKLPFLKAILVPE